MATEPVRRISFRTDVTSEGELDRISAMPRIELYLELWRMGQNGRLEVSEAHSLGYAYHREELDDLVKEIRRDLDQSHAAGRDWFRTRDKRR